MDMSKEFKKILKKLEVFTINKLNEIKQFAKNKISNVSSIIPNFIDKFTNIIDDILKLNFGPYEEHKIDYSEIISKFFLEVEMGNIQLKQKNDKGEEIDVEREEILIKYLNENLEIDKKTLREIIRYLLKNGLKNILIRKINPFINFTNVKFGKIKQYYEPTLKMIKETFDTLKTNISEIINDFQNKLNENIDSRFEFFIYLINSLFKKANILDIYIKKLEKIDISPNFKKDFLNNIQILKDAAISKLSNKFEAEMKELNKKIDKKIEQLKEKSKQKINELVDKTENKVFGYINEIL